MTGEVFECIFGKEILNLHPDSLNGVFFLPHYNSAEYFDKLSITACQGDVSSCTTLQMKQSAEDRLVYVEMVHAFNNF